MRSWIVPLLLAASLGCTGTAAYGQTCEDLPNLSDRNECVNAPPPGAADYVPPANVAKLCSHDDQCPAGSHCTQAGTCSRSKQCAKDKDCAWDERCEDRRCIKLPSTSPP